MMQGFMDPTSSVHSTGADASLAPSSGTGEMKSFLFSTPSYNTSRHTLVSRLGTVAELMSFILSLS